MKKLNEKFVKIADGVSFGMGTPTNIGFWLLAVGVWFYLGYTRRELFAAGEFLPDWFTSDSWNFPLNTITTLAELYIGFLVAAAANRSERKLREMIEHTRQTVDKVEEINKKQNELLESLMKYQKVELKKEEEVLKAVSKRK
ncbi:MAG: hypothetical protein AAB599_03075 [Patescibacteria group bacterium]